MASLAEAPPQMGHQHLTHRSLIADQLHQLINPILLQQILGALLLQGEAGIEERQTRTFTAPGFGFPVEPALLLHGVEQRAHMAA
ncbi:hypothetical protein D3C78_543240 [compost metagenome]